MKIPHSVRKTKSFKGLRYLKNNFSDSKNILKDKLLFKVKESLKPKRILSKEEMQKLHEEVLSENDNLEIPLFEDLPLVSIIIVNHNGEHHLKRLFNVISSSLKYYPNYEIIIVDNASTDNSKDLIESYSSSEIILIENDENESFSHANNQAVEKASGEYLLFMNNDIEPLNGFLNHMMDVMLSKENVGAVGARLIYPDCSSSKINRERSYTIQHAGLMFKESDGFVKPFNKDNGVEIKDSDKNDVHEVIGVTAATMLIKKDVFLEVGSFDERYIYGYEDVDLCLKLYKAGYHNYYTPHATLYHYEFGTQETNNKDAVRDRRLNNMEVFINKWNKWLRSKLFEDKINGNKIFSDKSLTVAFVVTQSDENTTAGDYFTALTLAERLKDFGWNIKYLAQKPTGNQRNWYHVDEDIDVLISLLDRYDLRKVKSDNGLLITVAWLRNWFDRWVEPLHFKKYDIVLASSKKACDFVKEQTGKNAILFPLATEPLMFNENVELNPDYECDYCFTGSYWDAKREIIDFLDPDSVDFKFNLYGANWNKVHKLSKYSSGFVDYLSMPEVYASSKITLDDANHVTKKWGSVNSRVFDSIASGNLVFTNGTTGNNELFEGLIPEYHSKEELTKQLNHYLNDENDYKTKIAQLKEIVLKNHTYKHRAEELKRILVNYIEKEKIVIKIPCPHWEELPQWGDFHVAEGLESEFVKKGYEVKLQILPEWTSNNDAIADKVFVLRGLSEYEPKTPHYNIMWNISHPELVEVSEYSKYDYIFISSEKWTNHIKQLVDVPVECMWQCTDLNRFYYDHDESYNHDLLFVGNSRRVYRKIIRDVIPTKYDLAVYGADWEPLIDKKYLKGEHIPNKELRRAYSSCKILLNDHWDDMKEYGFISNRIFDGLACGAFIVSDNIEGLDSIFERNVFTYDSKRGLKLLLDEVMHMENNHDTSLVEGHSYEDRVNQILNAIK